MNDASNRCILKSFVILWILILSIGPSYSDGFRTVCYFLNSAQYRSGVAAFHTSNVEPSLCTHIVFSYVGVTSTKISPLESNITKVYDELVALKSRNTALQILLSVGHVTGLPDHFIDSTGDSFYRSSFAKNVVHYVRTNNLDGVILEWFNIDDIIKPYFVKENFQELLRTIKSEFEEDARATSKPKLTLAVTTSPHKKQIDHYYNLAEMVRLVDFLSIRTVDLRTAEGRVIGPSSSLYALQGESAENTELNVNWIASYYMSLGVPAEKINIGIPTYGRTFTLARPGESSVGSRATDDGNAGKLTRIEGILSHFEICALIWEGGSVESIQGNRYYVRDNQWISYEDSKSVMQKACYVKQKQLGGITVWNLDLDDFTGQVCHQGKFPLLTAATRILRSANSKECESKNYLTTVRSISGADRPTQSKTLQQMTVTLLWIVTNCYV